MAAPAALRDPLESLCRDYSALVQSVRDGPPQPDDPQGFFFDLRRAFPSSSPHSSMFATAIHHRLTQLQPQAQQRPTLLSLAERYEHSGDSDANASLTAWRRALTQAEVALLVDVFQSAASRCASAGSPYLSVCFQHEMGLLLKGEVVPADEAEVREQLALVNATKQLSADTAVMVQAWSSHSLEQNQWHDRQLQFHIQMERKESQDEAPLSGLRSLLRRPSERRELEQVRWDEQRQERVLAMEKAALSEQRERLSKDKAAIKQRTRQTLAWEMRLKAQHIDRMRCALNIERQP